MRYRRYYIIATLIIAAIAAFSLSAHRERVQDDLFYGYIFNDDDFETPRLTRPITDGADIVESQQWHYRHINGRLPVHILVQAFCGIWGYTAFGVVNAAIFVMFVSLLVRLSFSAARRRNPWSWLVVILALLYLFPKGINSSQGPWFGIAVGVNYLWVGAIFCVMLLAIRKISLRGRVSWWIVPLAFFAGWSNEAYSIPLSGSLFFLLCAHRDARHTKVVATALAVWAGTALTVFAPGTFARVDQGGVANVAKTLTTLVDSYNDAWPFWIFAVALIWAAFTKSSGLKSFYRRNQIVANAWIVSLLMSIPFHTGGRSLTCLCLLSMILTLRLWPIRLSFGRVSRAIYVLVLAVVALHQVAIYRANEFRMALYRQCGEEFVQSPDGVFRMEFPDEPWCINSYVDSYDMQMSPRESRAYFSVYYGEYDKMPYGMSNQDYRNVIVNPDSFFLSAKRIPGTADMRQGDRLYISRTIPANDSVVNAVAYFYGTDFKQSLPLHRRIAYTLLGNKKAPKALRSYVLHTRRGDYFICEKILSTPSKIDLEQ